METSPATNQGTDLELVLTGALENAKTLYPEMVASAQRAAAALSTIKQVENDEEDEKANAYLVKSKLTYDKIKEMRERITKNTDLIKEELMKPEKTVSLEKSHTGSEALRVKLLRDNYAVKKAAQIEENNKKIEAQRNKETELARLRSEFTTTFHANILKRASALREGISEYLATFTLENFDEKAKRFSLKPSLKQADFEDWFIIPYDKSKITTEDFSQFLAEQKQQLTYDEVNKIYIAQAEPIVLEFKNKLPDLKVKLTEIRDLEKTNAAAAEAKKADMAKQAEAETKKATDLFNQQIETNKQEAATQLQKETLDAEFNAQVAAQQNGELTGVRKTKYAKITGPPADIVKIFSAVLFACYSNPSFEGHYKRDKTTKAVSVDDKGEPILQDWADKILTFFANNCDAKVDGLEIHEKIGTIIKK
jgi:hypothetical protein